MQTEEGLRQYEVDAVGLRRKYLVHVPRGYEPGSRRPTLVVLHGGGGSAEFAARVYGWPELSEREGSLIVFPEATLEDPSRAPAVRENPRIWNDGSTRSAVARRGVDDVGYLATVLDDVAARFAVDPDRLFVTGFSNGASMTFRAGIELADRIRAIAPVSGHLCLQQPSTTRPMSMLYIIGLADPLNPFDGGVTTSPWGVVRQRPPVMHSIQTWIRLIGADERPEVMSHTDGVKRIRYGPGRTGHVVHLYTIEGQGHEWPGARRTLPRSISGLQTKKLDATQAVWEFFAAINTTD